MNTDRINKLLWLLSDKNASIDVKLSAITAEINQDGGTDFYCMTTAKLVGIAPVKDEFINQVIVDSAINVLNEMLDMGKNQSNFSHTDEQRNQAQAALDAKSKAIYDFFTNQDRTT